MPSVLIVEKNASIKSHNIKVFSEDELFKKAGFKSKEGFARHAVWNVELSSKSYSIELYGKTTGRAGQENKYDFPPPVDSTLFFGACVLIHRKKDEVVSLTTDEWDSIYEHLFGGFEDVGTNDSDDDEEEDESSVDAPRTKAGYVKDGFVVDDEDEQDNSEVSSEEEYRVVAKKPTKIASSSKKPATRTKKSVVIYPEENVKMVLEPISDDTYLGCTNELQEEEYL
jgi:hypothetical protein